MWTKKFWQAVVERALKQAAAAVLVQIGADQLDALQFDWERAGGFALGGAFISVLFSIGSNQVTGDGPSLTHSEVIVEHESTTA